MCIMIVPTSSTLLALALCFIGINILKGDMMTSPSLADRRLQTTQTLNYRATYKADFQHLRDLECSADPPTLAITCYGTTMTILNVSDPSINCTQLEDPIVRDGATFICMNTCTDCTTVFVASRDIIDGPFASIWFMCEGDNIQNIDALYTFVDGNPGSCVATATTSSRNYHVGRLGVSCPAGTSRDFVYDDTYVECLFGDSTSPGFVLDITPALNGTDTYTCASGDNCEGAACTVPFDAIEFYTQSTNFAGSCVESLVTANAIPTMAPQIFTGSTSYKTQYEASWGQIFSSKVSQDACSSVNPTISVKCEASSSISYVNSTDPLMQCINVSSNELSCSGDIASIRSAFTTVTYTCIGLTASVSEVTFPDSSASCSGNIEDVIFSNVVALGLLCETTTDGSFYFSGDIALECADAANNFDYGGEIEFDDFYRYVCSESATFGVGSSSPQTIRNVTIGVEMAWLRNTDVCFQVISAPVPIAPTAPVARPTTAFPIITPTTTPIAMLSASPTTVPSLDKTTGTDLPSMKPVVRTTIAPIGINSEGSPTVPLVSRESPSDGNDKSVLGIAIGSAGGGFALAAVLCLVLFFIYRKQTSNTSKPCHESQNTESNTNDDFTSPRSPTPPFEYISSNRATIPLEQPSSSSQSRPPYPIPEESSNNRTVNEVTAPTRMRDAFVSPPGLPPVSRRFTRQSAPSLLSSSPYRSQYPTNHLRAVNDPSRSVAMARSSSPTLVSQSDNTTTTTSSHNRKKEPDGSFLVAI